MRAVGLAISFGLLLCGCLPQHSESGSDGENTDALKASQIRIEEAEPPDELEDGRHGPGVETDPRRQALGQDARDIVQESAAGDVDNAVNDGLPAIAEQKAAHARTSTRYWSCRQEDYTRQVTTS